MSDMLPRPEPRDAFKRALRSQLMAQAATALVRRETSWSRFQRLFLRPALAFAAIVLLLIAGAGKAAADSLPGDAAYPLKRAAEQVQLAFAIDDTTRLRILAEQADHRLAELAESIESHRPSTPIAQRAYAEAVTKLTQQVDEVRAQPNASQDKKTAAEDIVDAAHLKHSAVLDQLKQQRGNSNDDSQNIDRAMDESDKLHASGKPVRTAEPSDSPERARTPQPTKTATPRRSAEPTRTGGPTEIPEPTPQATRSAGPTGGSDGEQGDSGERRTSTPTPSVRR